MMVDGRVTKTLQSDDHFPFCLPAAPRDHQEHTCLSISKETMSMMMMIEVSIYYLIFKYTSCDDKVDCLGVPISILVASPRGMNFGLEGEKVSTSTRFNKYQQTK